MERIATPDRAVDLFGTGKDGFKDGLPPGSVSTALESKWFNALQEEVAQYIEASGITLIPSVFTQLRAARQLNALRQWTLWDRDGDTSNRDPLGLAYKTQHSTAFRPVWRSAGGAPSGGLAFSMSNQFEVNRFKPELGPATGAQTKDIIYDAGLDLFVVVGEADGGDAFIATGIDEATVERANPSAFDLLCVGGDGVGVLVAAGEHDGTDQYCVRSTDGTTWLQQAVPGAAGSLVNDVVFAGTVWVLVGETSGGAPLIWTSPDATGSGPYVVRTPGTGAEELKGVAYSPDTSTIIAVGFDGEIHRSTNAGVSWTTVRDLGVGSTAVDLQDVQYSNGVFVAIARTHMIYSVDDGLTWQILDGTPMVDASGGAGFTALGVTPRGQFAIGAKGNLTATFPVLFWYSGSM